MELTINLFIIILAITIGVIPSFYDLTKKQRGKKKKTKIGWFTIVLVLSLIILQIFQIFNAENEKQLLKIDQQKRDSLSRDFIIKNNKSIVTPFSDGLRKYGLKYDSARREIEKLVKDSAKKITVINSVKPEPSICATEFIYGKDSTSLKLITTFCTSESAAYELKGTLYFIVREINDNLIYASPPWRLNVEKLNINSDISISGSLNEHVKTIKTVYILVKATYKDKDGKSFNFDSLIWCNSHQGGSLTSKESIWIKDFYKRNGVK